MNIALVNVVNSGSQSAMNKDLNGGFGTKDYYGDLLFSKLLMRFKKRNVRLPVISLAFLQAIFINKGWNVSYYEDRLPDNRGYFDLILVYGSIVDYVNENNQASMLKERFPGAKIGFIGPFPSIKPELFNQADFVLAGEPEAFFMNEFNGIDQLTGIVRINSVTDMEALPSPNFDGFPLVKYNYRPLINKKPFLVLQASKGCPYSCRFYCVYGQVQGTKIRQRSAVKVADDIQSLQKKYQIKGIQFRDPLFGVNKKFVSEFTEELIKRKIKICWGIETRLDILNEENIEKMFSAGLRNINVGIETSDSEVARSNKRLLVKDMYQEKIIRFCKKKGIKIAAFYVLAMEGDTVKTMEKTLQYAIRLNTTTARFSVSTPYPGTGYFNLLEMEKRILTHNYELYDQFTLVYNQKNLSPSRVNKFVGRAYSKYYLRLSYFFMLLRTIFKTN